MQAVEMITGQSSVDYQVNNAGTAGPPVPAHKEYEIVKHSCISLWQQHCTQLVPSVARPSHAVRSTSLCSLVYGLKLHACHETLCAALGQIWWWKGSGGIHATAGIEVLSMKVMP